METGHKHKYGELWEEQTSASVCGPHCLSLWRSTRSEWERLLNFVKFVVGGGMKVRFWHDVWCVEDYLEKSIPQFVFNS